MSKGFISFIFLQGNHPKSFVFFFKEHPEYFLGQKFRLSLSCTVKCEGGDVVVG